MNKMNRRALLISGIVGLGGVVASMLSEEEVEDIKEVRTREYLDGLAMWNEELATREMFIDKSCKEYLFTRGCSRKGWLDEMEDQVGWTPVYSPRRRNSSKDRYFLFDLIFVQIGDKNVSSRGLRMETV